MRTIVVFIVTMLTGVVCTGLEAAKAAPLPGVAAADAQLKSTIEEVGWRRRYTGAMRIQFLTPTIRPSIAIILLPPITRRSIRRIPTIGLTAITGLITHPTEARPSWPSFFVRAGEACRAGLVGPWPRTRPFAFADCSSRLDEPPGPFLFGGVPPHRAQVVWVRLRRLRVTRAKGPSAS